MKIKTSELTGPALDWAVAKIIASERRRKLQLVGNWAGGFKTLVMPTSVYHTAYWANYSTNPAQAYPIIDREKISTTVDHSGVWIAYDQYNYGDEKRFMHSGESPLIAGLRTFVASKLGDEVDVPEKLK